MKKILSVACIIVLTMGLLLVSCQKKEEPAAPAPAAQGEQKPAAGGYGEEKPAAGGYGEEKPAEEAKH